MVTQVKHIGHVLTNKGDLINFENIKRQIPEKTNGVARSFKILFSACKCKLFSSQCCSLYGVEIIDIMSKQFRDIEVQWRKSVRYLTELHPRTHNELIPHVVGTPSIQQIMFSRILCFAKKELNHSHTYQIHLQKLLCQHAILYESEYEYYSRKTKSVIQRSDLQA